MADLRAVPDPEPVEVYGFVDIWTGIEERRCTIDVAYDGLTVGRSEDILLSPQGWVLKHPFDHQRMSTEDERAAVGWTW